MKKYYTMISYAILFLSGCVETNNLPTDYHPTKVTTHQKVPVITQNNQTNVSTYIDNTEAIKKSWERNVKLSMFSCETDTFHERDARLSFTCGVEVILNSESFCMKRFLINENDLSLLERKSCDVLIDSDEVSFQRCMFDKGYNYEFNLMNLNLVNKPVEIQLEFRKCVLAAMKATTTVN